MIDRIISHYKVIERIGEGGMGVLYLAEDLELNRKAVLKFLPPDMINDPEMNLRFKREAQSAGSLSHPNIVTIYDVGVYDNKTFIAMEYVEGKTLRELIKSDELTIERITDISVQICEGLNEAHSKGITHRDIKPENILIDEKGKVKIVDFGLAKTKNISKELTKEGSTVGTIKYMSPEQIRNQNVDHRSDIWSFGVILYEMITGKYPFKGEHDASLFYSIINQVPEPLARYKADISEGFQRIIDKALDKDSETRYQHIDEVLTDLRRQERDSKVIIYDVKSEKRKSGKKTFLFLSVIISVAIILFITFDLSKNKPVLVKPSKHSQLTFTGNISELSEISPDGQFTAYVVDKGGLSSLFVKDNFGEQSFEIFQGMEWITSIRWSPDGNDIFFYTQFNKRVSGLIIPKLGGKARPIKGGTFNCWSPDGKFIASIFTALKTIDILNKETNEIVKTIKLKGDLYWFIDLDWSYQGDRFVCLTFNEKIKKYTLWTIKTEGTQQQKVAESDIEIYSPRWSPDGNIYYLEERKGTRNLMKIEISSFDGTAKNEPRIINTGLEAYRFSLTKDNKKLVYTKKFAYSNLWKLNLEKGKKPFQIQKITKGTTTITEIALSPDGREVAFVNKGNIFIKPVGEGEMEQLTFLDSECHSPSWSPDGKRIAFLSGSNIMLISSEGSVQKIFRNINYGQKIIWNTDSTILYQKAGNTNFYIFNLITEEQKPLIKNEKLGWVFAPHLSGDGKTMVIYWSRIDGENNGLWIIYMENYEQSHLLYRGNAIFPLNWSEDGKGIYAYNVNKATELLYISSKNGSVKEKIKIPFDDVWTVDITSDGKTIVCAVGEQNSDVWMIENFDPDVE